MYIHRGPFIQRGRGIGSLLGSLFRGIVPALKALGTSLLSSPVTKAIGNTAKDAAIETGIKMAADAIEGKNMKQSLDENLLKARKRVAESIRKSSEDKQINQKLLKKSKKVSVKSKKRVNRRKKTDIFNDVA